METHSAHFATELTHCNSYSQVTFLFQPATCPL